MDVILHLVQSFLQEVAEPAELEKVRLQELSLLDSDYEGSDNTHSANINYKCINMLRINHL